MAMKPVRTRVRVSKTGHRHDDDVEFVVEFVRPVHALRVHPAVRAVVADAMAPDDSEDHGGAAERREGLRHPTVGDELVERRAEDGVVDEVARDALRVQLRAAFPQ